MVESIFSEKRYTKEAQAAASEISQQVQQRHARWMVSQQYLVNQDDVDHLLSRETEFCETIILYEEERVTNNQRLLLSCETDKVLERRAESVVRQERYKRLVELVQHAASKVMETRFQQTDITRLLSVHEGFGDFASFAYSPTLNFQKLGSLAILYHSLGVNLLDLVNEPKFCRQMGKAPRKISDPKTAIGFLGIDNCRMLYPILMAKPLLKWADKNTKLMAPKMWQHSIMLANATRMRLSDVNYREPDEGIFLGIVRSIGQFTICNHFTNCFDIALERVMMELREQERREDYFACAEITHSMEFLPEVLAKWEKKLTQKIIDYIEWTPRTLHLKNALEEDINDVPIYERGLHGAALGQGRVFTIYDMMSKSKAFSHDHAPYWFANMQMDGRILKSISSRNPGKFTLSIIG
ncbi:HDOD domain-containing protein [Photobacterium sp. TY1-4]|uniref:HDOD domain-containing protein n=1 Tax=Photobacterium sp. TY1-4 TaxID=2899122 RepID=UPI0021BDF3E6|nr:HDOD domain-containing protein [Photobacterium sp. TY1-4]UXI00016.1 HDOD domain-containing protein [Photobacterium sp. TY1-4]